MLTADEAIEAEIKGPTQGHTDDLLSSQKVKGVVGKTLNSILVLQMRREKPRGGR